MKIVIPFLIFFFYSFISFGQTGTLRGHIYDAESGEPIPFASVQLLNSDAGVISDIDGFFQLSEVPSGAQKIHTSAKSFPFLAGNIRQFKLIRERKTK